MENRPVQQNPRMKQIGLMDLLAMVIFFIPIFGTMATVKRSGGGILRYLLALPLSIALGTLIVSIDWKFGRAIWRRSTNSSEKVKNAVGFVLFVFQLFWIFVGLVSGSRLGAFLVDHLGR
jgi:hypothetical protein